MIRNLSLVIIAVVVFASCTSDPQEKALKKISKMEKELYADQMLDRDKGTAMIDVYVDYSKDYPKDTTSASFLFKAGEIAMNLQLGSQSVYYFKKAFSNYPTFSKAPECIFLQAFVYENQLNNLEEAKNNYELFIEKYPNHVLVKDAKASITYLGKSPEELIKMFQEQNSQK